MKNLPLIILLLISTISMAQQPKEKFRFFLSTTKFVQNRSGSKATFKIKKSGHDFIKVKKIKHKTSAKKDKAAKAPWAIMIDSVYYFNLRYSYDVELNDIYIKAKVVNKYAIFIVDKNTSSKIIYDGKYYNHHNGLLGLINLSLTAADDIDTKWCSNWTTKADDKVKILITNTSQKDLRMKGHTNSGWYFLSCKNINEILECNLTEEEIKNLTLEDILDLIEEP